MRRIFLLAALCVSVIAFFACSKNAQPRIPNRDKPVIYTGLAPADARSGTIDMEIMNWNDKTYHVGCDSLRGGYVQGQMIEDFLAKSDPAAIDRNGDGIIGYVLCIGDSGHRDSRGRTEAVRKTLGTWNGSCEPKNVKEGSVTIGGKKFKVCELEGRVMTGTDGSSWNPAAATEAMSNWVARLGNAIDFVVSNNDAMAMGCLQISNYPDGLPIFGYDAISDALEAVDAGKLTGTVSQDADGQVEVIFQLLRNMFDGLTGEEVVTSGITKPDRYGNKVSAQSLYVPENKSFLMSGIAVTKANCMDFKVQRRDDGIKQIEATEKKIFFSVFSTSDLWQTIMVQTARYYEPLFGLKATYVAGDGYSESSSLDKFTNLGKYDAYVIGLLRETSGRDYMDKLKY